MPEYIPVFQKLQALLVAGHLRIWETQPRKYSIELEEGVRNPFNEHEINLLAIARFILPGEQRKMVSEAKLLQREAEITRADFKLHLTALIRNYNAKQHSKLNAALQKLHGILDFIEAEVRVDPQNSDVPRYDVIVPKGAKKRFDRQQIAALATAHVYLKEEYF